MSAAWKSCLKNQPDLWPIHYITLIAFQQIAQHDYYKALVITHVNVGNEIFHVLGVANEVHRPSFTI